MKIDVSEFKEQEHCYGGVKQYYVYAKSPEMTIGSSTGLKDWILENGIKEASLMSNAGEFSLRTGRLDQTFFMPRVKMAVKLAAEMGIHADAVEDLLDEALEQDVTFLYDSQEAKSASLRFNQVPAFRTMSDSHFGVDLDTPQSYVLQNSNLNRDYNAIPKQRIGDAYDPSNGNPNAQDDGDGLPTDVIMNSTPEQLAQYAQNDDVPHVFEHGLVGTLVQTFDAVSMIDKYLPDMEEGLDRLGRLLFLFYWKPRDFEDAYGADDMNNMENQILSNFKSYGELVLDLLKKSDSKRRGTPSLAGE